MTHDIYLVSVDDSPEESLAGVAAHPPVVKVRDGRVAADRTWDSWFPWKIETLKQSDNQTRRAKGEWQKRDNDHLVYLLGTGIGINLHEKLDRKIFKQWNHYIVINIFYKPTASSGVVCLPVHFSFGFLQLPEFLTEDFLLFVSASADSGLWRLSGPSSPLSSLLFWVSGLAMAGKVLTRLKAENLGGWKAECSEGLNSCWLCRENLSIISGPLISDRGRPRWVPAESRTKLTSSSMYSLFMLSSWLFRSISLALPSLK